METDCQSPLAHIHLAEEFYAYLTQADIDPADFHFSQLSEYNGIVEGFCYQHNITPNQLNRCLHQFNHYLEKL
jgi:hypothetical protein